MYQHKIYDFSVKCGVCIFVSLTNFTRSAKFRTDEFKAREGAHNLLWVLILDSFKGTKGVLFLRGAMFEDFYGITIYFRGTI